MTLKTKKTKAISRRSASCKPQMRNVSCLRNYNAAEWGVVKDMGMLFRRSGYTAKMVTSIL